MKYLIVRATADGIEDVDSYLIVVPLNEGLRQEAETRHRLWAVVADATSDLDTLVFREAYAIHEEKWNMDGDDDGYAEMVEASPNKWIVVDGLREDLLGEEARTEVDRCHGIDILPGGFDDPVDAAAYGDRWVARYAGQGFYLTCDQERIPVANLKDRLTWITE